MCVEWMHCNRCYLRFQPKYNWYLTECHHIFCQMCKEKSGGTGDCIVCGQRNKKFVQLKNDIDSSIRVLFTPFQDQLKQLQEAQEFQATQSSNLLKNMNQKYTYAKKECLNYIVQVKALSAENDQLKKALQDSRPTRPFATSTPGTQVASQMDNASVVSSISNAPNINRLQFHPGRGFRMPTSALQQRPFLRPNTLNTGSYRGTPGSSISALSTKLNMAGIHKQPFGWPTSRNSKPNH